VREFTLQGLANTAWAFAKLEFWDAPFFGSLSSILCARVDEIYPRELTSIAWSLATLQSQDWPLFAVITLRSQ